MNKTTPDKEKLKEEFGKVIFFTPEFEKLTATQAKNIADWWLDKMEAQKADTIAIIERKLPDALHNYAKWLLENPNAEPLVRRGMKNTLTNDFLSILRKER